MDGRRLPGSLVINNERFIPILLRIEDRDELGRPENLVYLPNDRMVEVHGEECFLVVYAPEKCVSPQHAKQSERNTEPGQSR